MAASPMGPPWPKTVKAHTVGGGQPHGCLRSSTVGGSKTTGDEWMGAPAAAKRLGIRLVTLYRIIDSGALPAYKVRRVIRLKRADVDAYIKRCRVEPGTFAHLHPADELAYRQWKR